MTLSFWSGRIPGFLWAVNSHVPGRHMGEADLHMLSRWSRATLSTFWSLIPWKEVSQLMKKTDPDQQWAETSSVLSRDHVLGILCKSQKVSDVGHVGLPFHDETDFELNKKLTCTHCICPTSPCINSPQQHRLWIARSLISNQLC